ncbi:MAG: hypothetical protein PGN11_10265 [Quadrisphaera sp.]
MTKTRRTLAVTAALLALGGSLVGATSAMAADASGPQTHQSHHAATQAPDATVEVTAVDETGPDAAVGMGTPAYLDLLKSDQDVDAAQVQLVEFMKARGLQVELAEDEDGRPYAEYDPFVDANLDAVQAYWDARTAQG